MSLAFVFPGQGSQSLGMFHDLANAFPVVKTTFDAASEVLGYDLWGIVQDGPEEELNRTAVTQPAMLAAGVAGWRLWQEQGGKQPVVMAGHSLGEYTALVCAGALAFDDAVTLVAERGQFMQEAVPAGQGSMAAILGLDDTKVVEVCAAAAQGEVVAAVNFNSPGQVVIAGQAAAVQRAVELAKEAGAKRALVLAVSAPSHCDLMKPAAKRLESRLAGIKINTPLVPVINNADVASPSDPESIRSALVRQLYSPVRWVETIQRMASEGVGALVECGPGKVLVGLNKRIVRDMSAYPLQDPGSLEQALAELK